MDQRTRITTSVIATQITLNLLEGIKHTNYYSKGLKQKLNLVYPELIRAEKDHFDKFFDLSDKTTDEVYQVFQSFMQQISNVPIYDMQNIEVMIAAYNKDPKSINGICNKILNN